MNPRTISSAQNTGSIVTGNLSKSQLKMREQAFRKRVSASTAEPKYKAPIFGIPIKIAPSDSDHTQRLIKEALGDYDEYKPVIEKMFVYTVPSSKRSQPQQQQHHHPELPNNRQHRIPNDPANSTRTTGTELAVAQGPAPPIGGSTGTTAATTTPVRNLTPKRPPNLHQTAAAAVPPTSSRLLLPPTATASTGRNVAVPTTGTESLPNHKSGGLVKLQQQQQPSHQYHHHYGSYKRKRSGSMEEVDITRQIKETFSIPPLLSRILNFASVNEEPESNVDLPSTFTDTSPVLTEIDYDQNSKPNCDKALNEKMKCEVPSFLDTQKELKVDTFDANNIIKATGSKYPKEEHLPPPSPTTTPNSAAAIVANNWSLSSFLSTVDPLTSPIMDNDQSPIDPDKEVAHTETAEFFISSPSPNGLQLQDIDSNMSLAAISNSLSKQRVNTYINDPDANPTIKSPKRRLEGSAITKTTKLGWPSSKMSSPEHVVHKKKRRGSTSGSGEYCEKIQAHETHVPAVDHLKVPDSTLLIKTTVTDNKAKPTPKSNNYRLLARKKTPPVATTLGATAVVSIGTGSGEKTGLAVSPPVPIDLARDGVPTLNGMPPVIVTNQGKLELAQGTTNLNSLGEDDDSASSEVGYLKNSPSMIPSSVDSEYTKMKKELNGELASTMAVDTDSMNNRPPYPAAVKGPKVEPEVSSVKKEADNVLEALPSSLIVKIDLSLIKKIPILPYHYNNDINYPRPSSNANCQTAMQNHNLSNNNAPSSVLLNIGGAVNSCPPSGPSMASTAFASSNTANAWAPFPPTLGSYKGERSSLGMHEIERLPAQLSRFENFSPYSYKSSGMCDPTLPAYKDNPSNPAHLRLTENLLILPAKINWGFPSDLPCVYSPSPRYDTPFWRNIGLCPEITTYSCDDINKIAKNLKRSADRENLKNLKIMMYIDAVLYFILNGDYIQNKNYDPNRAHTIYYDTLRVCKHVSDLVQKGISSNTSDNTVMDQIFVIITQKIQALLYLKMFQCKKEQSLRNQRLLNQEFPKLFAPPPSIFLLGTNPAQYPLDNTVLHSSSFEYPSQLNPISPTPSPISSVGSVGGYLDGSKAAEASKGSSEGEVKPNRLHPIIHQQLNILENALISHHLWDLSESGISTLTSSNESTTSNYPRHLISSNPHPNYRDCFAEILAVCRQPLTLNSSVWHLMIYVKYALYYLGYWLNPTYYDPKTTITPVEKRCPRPLEPLSNKGYHKKSLNHNPPPHLLTKDAISGK